MANKYLNIASKYISVSNNKLSINLKNLQLLDTNKKYEVNVSDDALISASNEDLKPSLTFTTSSTTSRVINSTDYGVFFMVGAIILYSGNTLPDGYLACDGSAISRETYSDLFDVIGTTYGAGNGSTTFNVPNLTEVPVVNSRYIIKAVDEDKTFDPVQILESELLNTNTNSDSNSDSNSNS